MLLAAPASSSTVRICEGKIGGGFRGLRRDCGEEGDHKRAAGTYRSGRNQWCTAAGEMNSGERFHGLGAKLQEEGRGEMEREVEALSREKR